MRFIVLLYILLPFYGSGQAWWYIDSLKKNETSVAIESTDRKIEGYVLNTEEGSINIINSRFFPKLRKETILVTAIEKIDWRTPEQGYRDRKFMRKSGWQGAAIGAGIGTIGALILQDVLTIRRQKFSIFNCTDSDDYSILPKCEYEEHNIAYIIPPLAGFIGYMIGWKHAANIKVHSYAIMGNRDTWNSIRREVPLVSVTLTLD